MSTTAFDDDLQAARQADDLGDITAGEVADASPSPEKANAPKRQRWRNRQSESLGRPWRLGFVGLGIAVGLIARLVAANGLADLLGEPVMIAMAATSALVGFGVLLIASERDRLGLPLAWIAVVTSAAFATLNWVSPPFQTGTGSWDNDAQTALAVLGAGNGLLLAGIITLALVRRSPTFTVAATLVAAVLVLASNTVALRSEWAAITLASVAFGLVLLGWDRSPRREALYRAPRESPRISRAALSLASVALCGTAIQLWLSRDQSIPRSTGAIAIAVVLLAAAFASMIRVRREIERRETTLSEWTSWMREIRTNDFRSEIENFTSPPTDGAVEAGGDQLDGAGLGDVGELLPEPPRPLSFPGLKVDDDADDNTDVPDIRLETRVPELPRVTHPPDAVTHRDDVAPGLPASAEFELPAPPAGSLPRIDPTPEPIEPHVDDPAPPALDALTTPGGTGIFSKQAAGPSPQPATVDLASLSDLEGWLADRSADPNALIMAIEALPLDRYEALESDTQSNLRNAVGAVLVSTEAEPDMVAWIDGPYFMVAYADMSHTEMSALNKEIRPSLRDVAELPAGEVTLAGTLAMLRPAPRATLNQLVDDAVVGLIQARNIEAGVVPVAASE